MVYRLLTSVALVLVMDWAEAGAAGLEAVELAAAESELVVVDTVLVVVDTVPVVVDTVPVVVDTVSVVVDTVSVVVDTAPVAADTELVVAQRILVAQTDPKLEIDLMDQAYPAEAVPHNYYLAG